MATRPARTRARIAAAFGRLNSGNLSGKGARLHALARRVEIKKTSDANVAALSERRKVVSAAVTTAFVVIRARSYLLRNC